MAVQTHLDFYLQADERDFSLYEKALKFVSVAIGKEANSIWQQQNAYGRNPESIIIAKESASQKLYFAVGKILKLQKETDFRFLPKERVELDDSIRFEWCEDFYADALEALAEWRKNI